MPDKAAGWQPRSRRRARVVTAGVVVVVLAGAGTAWGLTRGSGASYRTALAGNGTVLQTLAATGTVSPVSHADESFQVAGTVAKVAVKSGQRVHAGQVLAHLDRAELRSELRSARSTLSSARSRMSEAESGQSVASDTSSGDTSASFQSAQPHVVATSPTGFGSGGTGTGSTGTGSGGAGRSGSSGSSGSAGLGQAQTAVRDAQQATDAALSTASQALQSAEEACGSSAATAPAATSSTDSPQPTETASPDPTPTPTSTTSGDACTTAGAALLAAQQEVDRDEQQVSQAEAALTKILSAMTKSASDTSHTSTGSPEGAGSRGSTTVSAADIALDQASIDQALSTVDTDLESLQQGTLRASISGRVAAVTVSHGDQVTASSSAPAFIIVGSRQEQTTIDLSATEIRQVKIGMTAHVAADGSSRVLTGHVVSVDSAGSESSSGSVTFPVTITLPSGTKVVSGAAAAVTLVIASVGNVLAVPTSAVHYTGTTAYVELLNAGKLTRKTVKVGAMGAALTEIDSGLAAGDRVVLADLNASVPSSSSNTSATFGGGGGFAFPAGGGQFVRRFAGGGAGGTGGSGTLTFGGPAG